MVMMIPCSLYSDVFESGMTAFRALNLELLLDVVLVALRRCP